MKRSPIRTTSVLGLLLLSSVARAEPSAQEKAQAANLFDQALKHFEAKQCKEAVPLFEGSHQLNPSVGALLYTADCYQQMGLFASSYGAFREAARLANKMGDKREKIADEKATEVKGKLSYLTIEVPPDRRVEGLEIKQDGKAVPAAVWNNSVPIDGGTHRLEFSAPGHEPVIVELKISEQGSKTTERAPALKPVKAAPTPTPAVTTQPEPTRDPQGRTLLVLQVLPEVPREDTELKVDATVRVTSEWGKITELPPGMHRVDVEVRCREPISHRVELLKGHFHTFVVSLPPPRRPAPEGCPGHAGGGAKEAPVSSLRTTGIVVGGVGLGLGILGGVLAWQATSKASDARDRGDTAAFNEQKTPYYTGVVVGGVGVAALVTGAVLVLSAPSGTADRALRVSPAVGQREGGLWLSGRW